MSPVPANWEEAHLDSEINECIPLFMETDRVHYRLMDLAFCRDKIDSSCMWLWRRTGIDWTRPLVVRRDGLAVAFYLWRPRYGNNSPIENRYCMCIFLGNALTIPAAYFGDLKAALTAFADQTAGRDIFFVVKQSGYNYPVRVEQLFTYVDSLMPRKLKQLNSAPREHGWPARDVWRVVDWS